MIWLSKEQIIYLHTELIKETGGEDGLRDEGILESAVVAPFQTYDSKDLFPLITDKAARLACGLTCNHPFIDGNKRIGAHALLLVLALNGITIVYTQEELANMFKQLASGTLSFEGLRQWVETHIKEDLF